MLTFSKAASKLVDLAMSGVLETRLRIESRCFSTAAICLSSSSLSELEASSDMASEKSIELDASLSRISVRLIRLFLCFLPSIEGACTLRGKPSSLSSPRSKAAARSCNAWPGVPPTLEPAPKCDGTTSTATANVADTSTHHATLGSLGIMPLCSLGFSPPSPLFHQIRFPSENLRVRRVPHAPSLLSRHLPCCVLLLLTDLAAPQVKT
mmetsp:Transcript_1275/g.2128  ORF Transcript_1275/g.2128 Transcript_1275/m.2128 type:complete len:209 (-) Transcript_1275:416-1042(-)